MHWMGGLSVVDTHLALRGYQLGILLFFYAIKTIVFVTFELYVKDLAPVDFKNTRFFIFAGLSDTRNEFF